ncbi:hypothetical protein AB0I82_35505 [Streptomyces sp. NPDC050315]|uniref:ParB/RepB/Spo0J family partition protein n=1 Tax=Streptomyces sp. NPDC050315 TaxID=3155039 RepID=UPI00343A2663
MSFGKKKKNRSIWDDPDAAEIIDIPLEQLHPNPFNPRVVYRDEDIAELTQSIEAEDGLLQDLSVAEVEPFLEYWRERLEEIQPERLEDLEKALGSAPAEDYVILIGHNRRLALERAGHDTASSKVTNSKIPRARLLGLPENMRRIQLNPIEEARGFREALDDGLTQSEVAAQTGCKQPHISRRVKLLKLPEEIQHAIMQGMPVGEAETLLDKLTSAEDQLRAWKLMRDEQLKASMAAARVLTPPKQRTTSTPEPQKTSTSKPVGLPEQQTDSPAKNKTDGAPSSGSRTSEAPDQPQTKTDSPSPAAEASALRRQACQELLAAGVPSNPRETLRVLAPALLATSNETARATAHGWLRSAAEPIGPMVYRPDSYFQAVAAEGDAKLTAHVALAVALAVAEERASQPGRDWDAQDREYVRHLTTIANYQPTAWEQERLSG